MIDDIDTGIDIDIEDINTSSFQKNNPTYNARK